MRQTCSMNTYPIDLALNAHSAEGSHEWLEKRIGIECSSLLEVAQMNKFVFGRQFTRFKTIRSAILQSPLLDIVLNAPNTLHKCERNTQCHKHT